MERNIHRINGNVERLHRWSDTELAQGIGHASVRGQAAQEDISLMQAELASRQPTEEIPVVQLEVAPELPGDPQLFEL